MSEPEATARICRRCGTFALLEPHEHRADDPWACERCLARVLERDAYVPPWAVRASRALRSVS